MSTVFENILLKDKKQEYLQNFIGVVNQSPNNKTKQISAKVLTNKKKAFTKNAEQGQDGEKGTNNNNNNLIRANRIEAELKAIRKKTEEALLKKKKGNNNFVDSYYTDKDRAAAVSAGTYDIKQSLQIKQKQDRSEALFIPEEADVNSIIALGLKEIKNSNPENGIQLFTKALELHSDDVNALILRSKCYLLLGEASKALEDAETALNIEKDNVRAICQKAESLYFLGQFEKSLMYFYRGYRIRPEVASFRLGIQKTQEAIENTINTKNKTVNAKSLSLCNGKNRRKITKSELEHKNTRRLLDKLSIDKEYLENLLQHTDLICADTNTENVTHYVKDAIDFLNKRQEFWRQQRTCTALQNYNQYVKRGLLQYL